MKIEITEFFQKTVEVDACDIDDALNVVREQYRNGNVVLNVEDFRGVEFDVFPSVKVGRLSHDDDICKIIDYLWKDEERHWIESNYESDHIFHVLRKLKAKYG